MCSRYKLGQSEEGRELLAVRLNGKVRQPRPALTPMVKFVANIHGDEAVGRELLLGLARHLTQEYSQGDSRIRWLLGRHSSNIIHTVQYGL